MSLRAWFERLSFSMVILAAVCWWTAYKAYTSHAEDASAKIALYTVLGAILLGVGLAGVRSRHRRDDY
jgi:hypothetical protein